MSKKLIKFRDYDNYPLEIIDACHYRDDYDDMPDGAFFQMAREMGLYDALIEMAEWEFVHTDAGAKLDD